MEIKKIADKYAFKGKGCVIKTSGVNRTTPNLERKSIDVKTPVSINSRLYRDPKKADLVDIELEKLKYEKEIAFLKEKAENEIKERKKAKEELEFKKQLQLALEQEKQKGEAQ